MPDQNVTYWDRSIKGAIPSDKLGKMVHYRGLIARGIFYLLDHDARVQSYAEQPCTIHYALEDSELSYAPDFLVIWYERKSSLLACKTETYLRDPKHAPHLLKTFASMTSTYSVAEVVEQTPLLNSNLTKSYLWNLLYNGECSTDLMKPLYFNKSRLLWKGATREHASSRESHVQ